MSTTINAQTRAFGLSLAITSVLSGVLVIAKETNAGLLGFMKTVTIHHWMTHGIFNLAVFLVLGLLLTKSNNGQGPNINDETVLKVVVSGFLLSCALSAGFFLFAG